jgi:hypothetical protein
LESNQRKLGLKEAEMKIVGVDLHAKQQSIAMLGTETGELTEKIIRHEGNAVREFYGTLEATVMVGIEAIGSMQVVLGAAGGAGNRLSGRAIWLDTDHCIQ